MPSTHLRAAGSRALLAMLACATVLGVCVPASHALAPRHPGYTFVRIDHPQAGSVTGPTTIVESGDVAGSYADAAGRSHGFVRNATTGAFTDIGIPTLTAPRSAARPGERAAGVTLSRRERHGWHRQAQADP